jgi:type VI secretion system protein ImpA
MPSDPLLKFDELIAPIPGGPDPKGLSVSSVDEQDLNDRRKADNPKDRRPGDTTELKKADWKGIIAKTQVILKTQSKDLRIAARLTEALVRHGDAKTTGFAGLRDGLRLMRLMLEQCWDRMYPVLDPEDPESIEGRATPFEMLSDPNSRLAFPAVIRMTPLVFGKGAALSYHDRFGSEDGRVAVPAEVFDQAVADAPLAVCETVAADLADAAKELDLLGPVFKAKKFDKFTPGLTHLRQAVEQCAGLAQQIVQIVQKKRPEEPSKEDKQKGAPTTGPGAPSPTARTATSREEAYDQIQQAAALLKKLEPHSPIPYLIQRAVDLGRLPFPEMIKDLVRHKETLTEMNRELGIKDSPSTPPPSSTKK